ncbi:hypothetical protein [Georgenia yuyongxinii]
MAGPVLRVLVALAERDFAASLGRMSAFAAFRAALGPSVVGAGAGAVGAA